MAVKLTAKLIEAFAGTFLSGRYDNAKPTPPFHRQGWALYCSDERQAGLVAPRGHAKSTAFTYDYILAECLFRTAQYVILIGSTEDKAAEQLSNLSEEIEVNEDMRREFGVAGFETQQKTEIIVKFDDGARFRILARGAEQKIRGAMWNGMRPDLIVCDDMEDDEQVMSKDRRLKFQKWFFRAAKQALSRRGRIRVHGTILHEDSLLARLNKNKMWKFLFFKAHNSYSDFSNLLWPEQWSAEALRDVQIEFEENGDSAGYSQEFLNTPLDNNEAYLKKENFLPMAPDDYESEKIYICGADWAISKADSANRTSNSYSDFSNLLWPEQWSAEALRDVQIEFEENGDSAGYSQEFLNTPLDNNEAYLKKENFLPMAPDDYESEKIYICGADWAISKADSANRTSFTCGGKDVENIVHVVGQAVGRWDSLEIVEEFFAFHDRWRPAAWYVENGQIWLGLKPMILKEMQKRDTWINIIERTPIKDKSVRGRSLQRRHKNGGMRFDKQASWYPGYEAELLTFTGVTDAVLDDQFDSTALMSIGFDEWHEIDEDDFVSEEEWAARRESASARGGVHAGRSITGY